LLTPLQSLLEPERALSYTPTSHDVYREALAAKITNERAKIRALEHKAEVRRQGRQSRAQDQLSTVVIEEERLLLFPPTFLLTPSSSGYHGTWGESTPSNSETL
jgi:hypothetical protein